MAIETKPRVTTAPSSSKETGVAPPTPSWWKTNRNRLIPLALVTMLLIIVGLSIVVVFGRMGGSRDNIFAPVAPVARAPAAAPAAQALPKVKGTTFTPGTYTLEQVKQFSIAECQSDAAKVVACYDTAVYQGDVERARAVLAHTDPAATRIITRQREIWQAVTKDGSKLVGFKIYDLARWRDDTPRLTLEPAGKGPFIPGKYFVTVDYLGDPKDVPWARAGTQFYLNLFLHGDGEWFTAPD